MGLVMGNRTIVPADFDAANAVSRPDLLAKILEIDPSAPSAIERAAGGVTQQRYLRFLDEQTSTASLGFRVDAAKTMINGSLQPLPLPEGRTLATLRSEADVAHALGTFLQRDAALAEAMVVKLESFTAALERSTWFAKHTVLRSSLLLIYDDDGRHDSLKLRITTLGVSYELPWGARNSHVSPWDGSPGCHEDGFLLGVQSLLRIMKRIQGSLQPPGVSVV
jgi:1D-myo-inositol-triphosphate 3-kinase